jgi:hypothetical protein
MGVATFTPTTPLSVGSHSVTAVYGGDANFSGSTSTAVTETVTAAATTTSLTASPNPSTAGTPVTFTATVSVNPPGTGTPTGTVTFSVDGTPASTANLTGGVATFTTSSLAAGSHTVTAAFTSSSTNFTASMGTVMQVVNQTTPTGPPTNQCFVAQVYRDLLGREADAAGLAFWTSLLDQGQISRFQFVIDIQNSLEYHTKAVTDLYNRLLHRPPDPAGLIASVSFLAHGGTLPQLEVILLSSDEYFITRGGGTNAGFVMALFQDVLNRAIGPSELQLYLQAMANGFSRARIAQIVVTSPEASMVEVQALYAQFLHRPADPAGLSAWTNALQQNLVGTQNGSSSASNQRGFTLEQVTAGIVSSQEYFSRLTC